MHHPTIILAIETSCDETAVAIVSHSPKATEVLSNIVSSQIALHAPFGGVVPDLAAREHAKNILPVLKEALASAHISKKDVTAIAIANGPGLIPALLIGTIAAKTLAYVWNKPLLGIHHIEGHIYANFISEKSDNQHPITKKAIEFPLLALVVSGGHTQLVLMRNHFDYEILGETQDDAAGEAFDKVAKMLGLPYPGGPIVAKRADAFRSTINSQQSAKPLRPTDNATRFPRPMIHSKDYNFSFSGLKTSVLYTIKKHPGHAKDEQFMNEICYEFQEAVIETLVTKTRRAIEEFHPKTLVIAGGVSANTALRARLQHMVHENFPQTTFITPEFAYSLDNAAMIAAAAAFRWERMSEEQRATAQENWKTLLADSNLTLQDL
ncbi:MAG: tRNA (adenosine(37)-N6)-threonylcarbamoyltransferase complex transferase subunit TsaD [Candidatus Moranbacteria bacterium]|nr:tRNA (adenosine(37)-N6)-threonylcarbamoyltransferase complex transferase subunit TsaD [Candidatus Moranbacteria bacterium]